MAPEVHANGGWIGTVQAKSGRSRRNRQVRPVPRNETLDAAAAAVVQVRPGSTLPVHADPWRPAKR